MTIGINDFQQKNVSFSVIKRKDLPAHCPPIEAQKWNMHPKVFMQFSNKGEAVCPYCGSKYQLVD
ncbi:MAG: zinc-finger domain-containing protein [Gammaproteobacteria bacterium]|uniref:Zinc finger CHCC-type domain-containing protein n=1 Tax=endosymbiont of Bathymodiolus septemdierum str. Myojin knoll TaxID=1303921 RepID=A0A0P0US03_9GAMM|nr:zinc-finger domain-containing protein [Bathymodiolus septemdierum thioautotrophic gill symbiont]RUA07091.1 MAG: zinc-finger domain-containing protein [Gammaproteobacteria bacterium]BAS67842.1 conserved hypothetical protein [endosymbiont of Bathymodiolus septemdierum str. Myojin knoll]